MSERNTENSPCLLGYVIQAVASLKDSKGSTPQNIFKHVIQLENATSLEKNLQHWALQVRRALTHCLRSGIFEQENGRYKLNSKLRSAIRNKLNNVPAARKVATRRKAKRKNLCKKLVKTNRKRRHSSTSSSDYSLFAKKYNRACSTDTSDSDARLPAARRARMTGMCRPRQRKRQIKFKNKRGRQVGKNRKRRGVLSKPTQPFLDKNSVLQSNELKDFTSDIGDRCERDLINDQNASIECDNADCLCKIKEENIDGIPNNQMDDMPNRNEDRTKDYIS